ncbi:MAG TPA: hypothetical protein VEI97_12610, partial [bacterium]|nr:hypothetical protein [bacterium]
KTQRREYLKANGMFEWGPEDNARAAQERKDQVERARDEAASVFTKPKTQQPLKAGNIALTPFKRG